MADLTLNHLFLHAIRTHGRSDMFLVRREGRYVGVSSQQFDQAVRETSQGLATLGIAPGDRVALLSENRLEWAQADLAILGLRAIVVPVYPTLLSRQIAELLHDCLPVAMFCSTPEQAQKIAEIRGTASSLRHVISFEPSHHDDVMPLDELRSLGRKSIASTGDGYDERVAGAKPEDVATILYTSGTTGDPKGVMLTHRNIVFNVTTGLDLLPVTPGARCLSFLPLSHIFERTCGYYAMMYAGATIAYAESVETVAQNMLEIRPTVMVCVPRFFEKIYARLLAAAAASSPFGRRIFSWAQRTGLIYTQRAVARKRIGPVLSLKHRLADRLVFRKLRTRTGGRLHYFVSGGAPLPQEIAEFFYAAGLPILEGYGLTETSPVVTVNTFENFRPGTVGQPMPGIEVKINSDGEIVTRNPSVMKGYHNKPKATAEALRDGWFHTGDVGQLDADGFLRVTDRKKDLIVTAAGKNIAPQVIEHELAADRLIDTAALIGDRRKYLVALIIPHFENLRAWARHKGIAFQGDSDLVESESVKRRIERTVNDVNDRHPSYEQVKRFRLLDHEFSVTTGELTPTLKVKRRFLQEKYAAVVEELYAVSGGRELPTGNSAARETGPAPTRWWGPGHRTRNR